MKYVMFERTLGGCQQRFPIIFPDFMVHKDVAQHVRHMMLREHRSEVKPVSAGSVRMFEVDTSGDSETLQLKSQEGDDQIIAMFDYLHGMVT